MIVEKKIKKTKPQVNTLRITLSLIRGIRLLPLSCFLSPPVMPSLSPCHALFPPCHACGSRHPYGWTPAFAGVTGERAGVTNPPKPPLIRLTLKHT